MLWFYITTRPKWSPCIYVLKNTQSLFKLWLMFCVNKSPCINHGSDTIAVVFLAKSPTRLFDCGPKRIFFFFFIKTRHGRHGWKNTSPAFVRGRSDAFTSNGFHWLIWRTQSSLNFREIRAGLQRLWESQSESGDSIHHSRHRATPVATQLPTRGQFGPNLARAADIWQEFI